MNIYSQILIDEAQARGIEVEEVDEEANLFRLTYNGQSILCRESLTEKTSAVSMTICSDKRLTQRILKKAGFRVPRQMPYQNLEQALGCIDSWGSVVVKPLIGEQGQGITVDIDHEDELKAAVEKALQYSEQVIIEEYIRGRDLRIIVIDHQFVAAIERIPAMVKGNGIDTVGNLIELNNQKLVSSGRKESQIPVSSETERVISKQGYIWDDVPQQGMTLQVYKTANYHTGGTITDVTEEVSPFLRDIAEKASYALQIPVVGFDFIVTDFNGTDYVIIEANERPGLANHEPQPTAQKFIDFLFPQTKGKA